MRKGPPTSQTRVIELDIPQPSLIKHLKLLLVNLGHIRKVLLIIRIHALRIRLALLITHVEPRRGNHGQLDVLPLLLGRELLHELQLMQVRLARLAVMLQLGAGNDAVARHHLAVLLDQADHVRVVQAEHARLGLLEGDGALELVPHQTPEAGAIELAAVDGLEAEFLLQLDDVADGFLLDGREAGLLRGETLVADGFTDGEKVLGTQEGAHVFGLEGSHFDLVDGVVWEVGGCVNGETRECERVGELPRSWNWGAP